MAALRDIRTIATGDEVADARVEKELTDFVSALRSEMGKTPPSGFSASVFADRVFNFLDLRAIARSYLEYTTGDLLAIMVDAFRTHFIDTAAEASWAECLDRFEGLGQIPLMTVHKSKGLEYDTIIFVGLDDQAWWAHRPGDTEGLSTFFVALSRAKQRAIFAFCQERGQRVKVAELYNLLKDAGVREIAV